MDTLTLSKDTIQWLLEMQEKFDSKLRADKGISDQEWHEGFDDNHYIALKVEIHEFMNTCYDSWKYWKSKPVDCESILDEAIDVIHFIALIANKLGADATEFYEVMEETSRQLYQGVDEGDEIMEPVKLIKLLSDVENVTTTLGLLLVILNNYGFTEQDVIEQYKRKNAINFERLEEGY